MARDPSCVAQRGIVLFVAMVLLLILSLLGVALASSAVLENRMSTGMRNLQLARMAADSALAEGHARVLSAAAASGAAQVCAQMPCALRAASSSAADPAAFMLAPEARAASVSFHRDLSQLDGSDHSARLQTNPVYVVEDLGQSSETDIAALSDATPKTVRWFRITASAQGGATGYSSAVEQTFAVVQP